MRTSTRISLAALAIALVSPDVALAQHTGGLDDIIVTARKREENLQSVPISVTAIGAEALKNQSVQSVKDIQYQTPSLTIAPTNGDRNNLSITIRGQNVSDTLLTLDPAIGVYIDGVNYAKTIGTELATLADVQRVEVLKGPQGTLFGRNTTGGALSITTKLPTDKFEGELQARTDEYGRVGGTGIVNLPLSGDMLALRLVGSYDWRASFGHNVKDGRRTGGDLNGGGIRGTLLWKPTDTIKVVLRGDYNKTSTSTSAWKARYIGTGAGIGTSAANEIRLELNLPNTPEGLAAARAAYIADGQVGSFWDVSNSTSPSISRVTSWGGSATISVELGGDTELKSISSYRNLTRYSFYDGDGSSFRIQETAGITSQKLFAEEAQLTGKFLDGGIDWIIGGFYSRETGNDGSQTRSLQATNTSLGINDGDVVNKSAAAFGQFTWHMADRINFTGGLRYTKDWKTLISRNRVIAASGAITCNVPTPVSPGVCSQSFSDKWDAMSYTAVLDFKPTDNTMMYIKTSRGYRSGGYNLRGTGDPLTRVPFGPETVTDYEAGIKSDLLDRRLRVNLAVYRSDYKGIQRTVIVPSPLPPFTSTVTRNAAVARINGVEAEITAKPTDNLTLRATGALTDAKYTQYSSGGVDLTYQKFNTTPKWTYTLSAGYDLPFADGPMHLQADWVWTDDIYWFPGSLYNGQNGQPDLRGQKAYGLLNARISKTFQDDRFEVALFVRNALNKKYFTQGLDLSGATGVNAGIPGDPRVIAAEASFRF